jgi:hypothetical protein
VKRKAAKPPQPPTKARAAQEPDAASAAVLPMEVQVGDRFTEGGLDWEVLTRPAVMHGEVRAGPRRAAELARDRAAGDVGGAAGDDPAQSEVSGLRTMMRRPSSWI